MLGGGPLVDLLHNIFVKLHFFQGMNWSFNSFALKSSLGFCCKMCNICLVQLDILPTKATIDK